MKTSLMLALVVLFAGCSIAREIALPNGEIGYVVSDCPTKAQCYNRAAKLCGGKYEIVNDSTSASAAIANGVGIMSPEYVLTIRCPN